MLVSVPVKWLVATALGFLSGLGIGGGSLLILWLTLVLDMPQEVARTVNLLFFLPSALIACCFRWKQGALKPGYVLPAAIAGCIAAGGFSLIARNLDTGMLKKGFGILLMVTGLRELTYRPK